MTNNSEETLYGIEQNIRRLLASYMVLGRFPKGWSFEAYNEYLMNRQTTMRCILLIPDGMNSERYGRTYIAEKLEAEFPSVSVNVYDPFLVCLCFDRTGLERISGDRISAGLRKLSGDIKVDVFESEPMTDLWQVVSAYHQLCAMAEERYAPDDRAGRTIRLYGLEGELLDNIFNYDRDNIRVALEEISQLIDGTNQHSWTRDQSYFCFLWRYIDRCIYQKLSRRTTSSMKLTVDQKLLAATDLEEIVDVMFEFIEETAKELKLVTEGAFNGSYHRILEMAKQYVTDNCSGDVSLERVAREVGFSSFYLSKLFKKEEHINYKDFVISVRMERAKQLILEGRMNVSEVAEAVGYNNNYFGKLFKAYFGVTAKDMRLHMK